MEVDNKFNKEKYLVVRNAISLELADFICDYFLMKRKVVEKMKFDRIISPYINYLGTFGDDMSDNCYGHYADIAMETLLKKLKPQVEQHTGRSLYETYTYARAYQYGNYLRRHKDRESCEISSTLNLGGDSWPIYLDPTGGTNNEGVEVILRPGDMLLYKANFVEHWRYSFTGTSCVQVFLHYMDVKTDGAEDNKYDRRPFLGLPVCLRK
tara:strand:+ start:216 stop:845 length:630 start_codon:yes stop_codon:yes gene_type:complete